MSFKVGDNISRLTRIGTREFGRVVVVVNAFEKVQDAAKRTGQSLDSRMERNCAQVRNHESYLIYEDGRILWPRAKHLRISE